MFVLLVTIIWTNNHESLLASNLSYRVRNKSELQITNKAKSNMRNWRIIRLLKQQKSAQIATKPGQIDAEKEIQTDNIHDWVSLKAVLDFLPFR